MLECIKKIEEVDNNNQLYYDMLMQPVFINNTIDGTDMDSKVLGKKLRQVLKFEQSYLIRDK